MKTFAIQLGIFAFAALVSTVAHADLVLVGVEDYTGVRSTSGGGITVDGLEGNGQWDGIDDNGFAIEWQIEDLGSTFKYTYTITGDGADLLLSKGLSHFMITMSGDYDFWHDEEGNIRPDMFVLIEGADPAFGDFASTGESGSTPLLPSPFFGAKFETPDEAGKDSAYTLSFYSIQAPVWGSFYAKDGNDQPATVAYTSGLGEYPTQNGYADSDGFTSAQKIYWIATPDTLTIDEIPNPVPEPSTLLLATLGAICIPAFARRRRLKSDNAVA